MTGSVVLIAVTLLLMTSVPLTSCSVIKREASNSVTTPGNPCDCCDLGLPATCLCPLQICGRGKQPQIG